MWCVRGDLGINMMKLHIVELPLDKWWVFMDGADVQLMVKSTAQPNSSVFVSGTWINTSPTRSGRQVLFSEVPQQRLLATVNTHMFGSKQESWLR